MSTARPLALYSGTAKEIPDTDTLPQGLCFAPSGLVQMFAGSSVPSGWLELDGSAVSRSTYAALFSAISTTYGVGDGSTTFNLPNMCGRGAIGVGTGSGLTARSLAATGGEETHVLSTGEMPSHNHPVKCYPASSGNGNVKDPSGNYMGSVQGTATNIYKTSLSGGNMASDMIDNTGSGTAHNNMQPFLVLKFIIKT